MDLTTEQAVAILGPKSLKEGEMAKILKCGKIVEGCSFEARGTEDEILQTAGKHAKEAHGMEVTGELVEKVRGVIEDESEESQQP